MFRRMRRHTQQLEHDAAEAILEKSSSGVLALLGDDDYPYAVPLSYVYQPGFLYFHSALSGHKIDAIRAHDKASFCVIDADNVVPEEYTTYFRSVIAFGRISLIEDETEQMRVARLLAQKYRPEHDEEAEKEIASGMGRMHLIELRIEHLTGKEAIELVRSRS